LCGYDTVFPQKCWGFDPRQSSPDPSRPIIGSHNSISWEPQMSFSDHWFLYLSIGACVAFSLAMGYVSLEEFIRRGD